MQMAEFVSESESDDDELPPPAKIPRVDTSDEDDEEAAEFAPTGLDDEEEPQSGADDWVIGLVYSRTLARVVESHPLFGSHYLGQSVRSVARWGTNPQKVAETRWREENADARRVPKRLGLLAVIREHGADALDDVVIDFQIGYRRDVQPWADEQEKGMIAAYGGPLRDMHARLPQTLNLTDGGKGDVECKGRIALNNLKWRDFQLALTEFVNEHGTAYVPYSTILPSGYKIGREVSHVRTGLYWEGWPDEEKRKSWLESLPKWTWNAAHSDEQKAAMSKAAKQQFAAETDEQRAKRIRKNTEAHRRPEVRAAASEKSKQQFSTQEGRDRNAEGHKKWWAGLTAEDRAEQIRKTTEGSRRPEVRASASEKSKQQFATQEARDAVSQRSKQQWASQEARDAASERKKQQLANETDEQRAKRIRNQTEGARRPEVRAAASEKSKQQFSTQEGRDRNAEGHKKWWAGLTAEDRAEQIRKTTEGSRRPEVRASASEKSKQQFATQEARDLAAKNQQKVAIAKHEAKLATLSEAEQAKARASFQRSQDKHAHRKRRLDALRRIAGWEHAAQKDLAKANAAGIVLQVCSCGVVCECGQGAGSSS